jgi:hypothetical protein
MGGHGWRAVSSWGSLLRQGKRGARLGRGRVGVGVLTVKAIESRSTMAFVALAPADMVQGSSK